ncbi:MAG: U32 family peptidase [Desulfuromonadaceae bacterium]
MSATTAIKPELLAPCGSLEAFFAAMQAGADAVYVGLKEFSARAKAKNFSLAELERMTAYAHQHGRKLYVTLNTLVKERELPELINVLASLEAIGVDALIIQDLAVWRLARRHFPGLELHASTQLTIHNRAGVRMLEKMGFSRAVLARELSLAEIGEIRSRTKMELEHFIHGALCFSFSGQCYFSSFLGGKSGNRGRCAQPCRRRYRYRQHDGYYFSTNDLSAIDLLPQLSEAGVISFKIEGRMKSAEYVSNVVSAYRIVLDAPPAKRTEAAKEAKNLLKASFGRPPTKGFLPGGVPTDIAIPSIKGATGRLLGEVAVVRGQAISFKTRDRLHVGDRLRIQPKSDQSGTAFTVKTLLLGRNPVKRVNADSYVTVPSPFQGTFQVGDGVFKVSSEQAFTLSGAACRRKLDAIRQEPVPVDLELSVTPDHIRISGGCDRARMEGHYPLESYPADNNALSLDLLRGVFQKTAETPFVLNNLATTPLPAVVIPPKRLKEIRREFYRALQQELEGQRERTRRQHRQSALDDLLPAHPSVNSSEKCLSVAIRDLRDAQVLNDPSVDRLIVPLTMANAQESGRLGKRGIDRSREVVWDLPFILFDPQWPAYRQAIRTLLERGFSTFRLNNLGHFALFEGLDGVQLVTGYRLFALNSQAILAWQELGAAEATLYLEDDRDNLAELLQRPLQIPLSATVYASVPLITSRIPIKGVRGDTPVLSDRGDAYRVSKSGDLTIITSATDFSLLGRLGELQRRGCQRYLVELAHLGPFSPKGKEVMDALKKDRPLPNTSTFNFDSGLE